MVYLFLYSVLLFLGLFFANNSVSFKLHSFCRFDDATTGSGVRVNVFIIASFVAFSVLSAARADSVGMDTSSYSMVYKMFAEGKSITSVESFATTIEYGYLLFTQMITRLFHSRFVFFLINGIIIYGCYLKYIHKYSCDLVMSVMLFTSLFFTSTFNVMRQYVAVGVLLIALIRFKKRKYISTALLFVASFLVHQSTLIFFPLFVLFLIPNKGHKILFIEIGIVFTFAVIRIPVIFDRMLVLFNYGRLRNGIHFKASDSSGIMAWLYLLIVFVGVVVSLMKKEKEDEEEFAFNLITASVGTGFALLAKYNEMFARAGVGYIFFIVLLIPQIVNTLFKGKRNRMIVKGVIYLALLFAMYITGKSYEYSVYS